MASRSQYGLRPRTGRNPRMVPGEFPSPCTLNIDHYAEGDDSRHISNTVSPHSAPGSLQHTSLERAASPHTSGSLPPEPEGLAASPSSPLMSVAREESVSHGMHAEHTGTGNIGHMTQYAESPVKAEPDPEGLWFTVGRNRQHLHSILCTSTNQMG